MNEIITKDVFGLPVKGTKKQVEEMYDLVNYEDYTTPRFGKYFYRWVCEGTGVYYFPKPQYCSLEGDDYAVALLSKVNSDVRHSYYT